MEYLTCGMINSTSVNKYLVCLNKCEGDINIALQMAYDYFNLNTGASTEDSDSWYEALAQYNQ